MSSNFIARDADGYDAVMGRWSQRLASTFLDFSGLPARGRVLDAGCGTGSLTVALTNYPQIRAIDALDFQESFVVALRGRATDPRINAQVGDVCALPYGDGEFDAAYSLLVLHFVSDAPRALREMRRVLQPGGIASAAVWAYGGMPSWRLFWDTVRSVEPDTVAAGIIPVKRPLTEAGELRAAFEDAYFAEVAEAKLTVPVAFEDFDDYWHPMVYGQGAFGSYFDAIPQARRNRLRDAVREAYLAEGTDGPRAFINEAWAVRGIA